MLRDGQRRTPTDSPSPRGRGALPVNGATLYVTRPSGFRGRRTMTNTARVVYLSLVVSAVPSGCVSSSEPLCFSGGTIFCSGCTSDSDCAAAKDGSPNWHCDSPGSGYCAPCWEDSQCAELDAGTPFCALTPNPCNIQFANPRCVSSGPPSSCFPSTSGSSGSSSSVSSGSSSSGSSSGGSSGGSGSTRGGSSRSSPASSGSSGSGSTGSS